MHNICAKSNFPSRKAYYIYYYKLLRPCHMTKNVSLCQTPVLDLVQSEAFLHPKECRGS